MPTNDLSRKIEMALSREAPLKELTYVIGDPEGLHARNASALAAEAKRWDSTVTVSCRGASCSATDPVGLMALDARIGDEVTVRIEGLDEWVASRSINAFFECYL